MTLVHSALRFIADLEMDLERKGLIAPVRLARNRSRFTR